LSLEQYREAKKDNSVAVKLRAQKIIELAMSDRPLVSMVKEAFTTTRIPFKPLLFGYAAARKGYKLTPPPSFNEKLFSQEYLESLLTYHPAPDHWSDQNILNYTPTMIAGAALFGKNPSEIYKEIKSSKVGKARSDLFTTRNFEFSRRIAYKLLELGLKDKSFFMMSVHKNLIPEHQMPFLDKFIYCNLLSRRKKQFGDIAFCQRFISGNRDKIEKMNKQISPTTPSQR
jgi:hypothetical protein